MRPPPIPGIPSRPVGSSGRLYRLTGSTGLACWWIEDAETLPLPEDASGFWVFGFVEGHRVGYLAWAAAFSDVERVVRAFLAALEPDEPQRGPEGEIPHIRPAERPDRLRYDPETSSFWLPLDPE